MGWLGSHLGKFIRENILLRGVAFLVCFGISSAIAASSDEDAKPIGVAFVITAEEGLSPWIGKAWQSKIHEEFLYHPHIKPKSGKVIPLPCPDSCFENAKFWTSDLQAVFIGTLSAKGLSYRLFFWQDQFLQKQQGFLALRELQGPGRLKTEVFMALSPVLDYFLEQKTKIDGLPAGRAPVLASTSTETNKIDTNQTLSQAVQGVSQSRWRGVAGDAAIAAHVLAVAIGLGLMVWVSLMSWRVSRLAGVFPVIAPLAFGAIAAAALALFELTAGQAADVVTKPWYQSALAYCGGLAWGGLILLATRSLVPVMAKMEHFSPKVLLPVMRSWFMLILMRACALGIVMLPGILWGWLSTSMSVASDVWAKGVIFPLVLWQYCSWLSALLEIASWKLDSQLRWRSHGEQESLDREVRRYLLLRSRQLGGELPESWLRKVRFVPVEGQILTTYGGPMGVARVAIGMELIYIARIPGVGISDDSPTFRDFFYGLLLNEILSVRLHSHLLFAVGRSQLPEFGLAAQRTDNDGLIKIGLARYRLIQRQVSDAVIACFSGIDQWLQAAFFHATGRRTAMTDVASLQELRAMSMTILQWLGSDERVFALSPEAQRHFTWLAEFIFAKGNLKPKPLWQKWIKRAAFAGSVLALGAWKVQEARAFHPIYMTRQAKAEEERLRNIQKNNAQAPLRDQNQEQQRGESTHGKKEVD